MSKPGLAWVLCCLLLLSGMQTAHSTGTTPAELQLIAHEAQDGSDGAQLLYGLAYLEGRYGLKPDAAKGVHWLRRSARTGNPYAQLMLGDCYIDGTGVAKDPQQAARWWRKAALGGNPQAQYLIGKACLEGTGTDKDPTCATDWLTKSAEQGNKDAQYLLGKMYKEGYVVPLDNVVAQDWLSRAAEQGHSDAINLLAVIKDMLDLTTGVYQQSADVLIDKARQGDPQAEYELGLRYESGAWDVEQDNEQALKWITMAANAGNGIAMKTLADIYQHGDLGLRADPVKAAEWKKRAEAHH